MHTSCVTFFNTRTGLQSSTLLIEDTFNETVTWRGVTVTWGGRYSDLGGSQVPLNMHYNCTSTQTHHKCNSCPVLLCDPVVKHPLKDKGEVW